MGPSRARLDSRCPLVAIGPSSRRLSWYCSGSCERLSTHSGAYTCSASLARLPPCSCAGALGLLAAVSRAKPRNPATMF